MANILVNPEARPYCLKARPAPYSLTEKVIKELQHLQDLLHSSQTLWLGSSHNAHFESRWTIH